MREGERSVRLCGCASGRTIRKTKTVAPTHTAAYRKKVFEAPSSAFILRARGGLHVLKRG